MLLSCVISDRKLSTSSNEPQGLEIFGGGYRQRCNRQQPAESRQTGFSLLVCMCARLPRSSTQRPVLLPGGRHRGYPEGEPTVAAASRTAIIIFGHYAPYYSTHQLYSPHIRIFRGSSKVTAHLDGGEVRAYSCNCFDVANKARIGCCQGESKKKNVRLIDTKCRMSREKAGDN